MKIANEMKSIISELNYHTKLYDAGTPIISDTKWDEKYFRLKELEEASGIVFPNSPTQTISYELISELKKVRHNHPMLSLDKTQNWNEFIRYFNSSKNIIGMLKCDGLTCSLRYINGELVSAETRGDGEIGEDILHNAKVISSIPKQIPYESELIIDGEIVCLKEDFKEFENEYKNPRNFASGSIRLLDSNECAKRKLTFIAWNIVKGLDNDLLFSFSFLEEMGFFVVPHTSSFDYNARDLLCDETERLGIPIDGLVGRYVDRDYGESLGATDHHSRAAYAFKFKDEEVETRLKDIVYETSRNGEMTPVAVFETIELEGTEVSRASLHNLSIMEELSEGFECVDDIITIVKANQIIPQIVKWEHPDDRGKVIELPEVCPYCGKETTIKISETGIRTLRCSNEECECRIINRLDHFVGKKGLDIKGLSKATLGKLLDWGYISDENSIFYVSKYADEWKKRPGFGIASVNKITDAIEEGKNCYMWQFISSLGIRLIGSTISKDLEKRFETYDAFRDAIDGGFEFWKLPNYGWEIHKSIVDYNWLKADEIAENLSFKINSKEESAAKETCSGLTIVITGKLKEFKNRDALKDIIENCGGKVAGSVTGKTSILINNDINSTTGKNKTAKDKGIPIMSEKDFIEKYLK